MSSYLFYMFLLLALTIGLTVQENPGFDVDAFKENFVWTDISLNGTDSTHPDLVNAVQAMVNGLGEAGYSFAKWVAEFSAQNPTIPYKLLIFITILAVLTPIIILLVKLFIIIFLLTKEYFQNRKEKKELNRLKEKKDG